VTHLFAAGAYGPEIDAYRDRVRRVVTEEVKPLVEAADQAGLFPRQALAALGAAGLIRERWSGPEGDTGRSVILHEELGKAFCGGVAVGVSLAIEVVGSALFRFGRTPLLRKALDGLLDGSAVGCIGASEPTGGSDLGRIRSTVTPEAGGWRVRAEKKYLSLGRVCDFALLLCKVDDGRPEGPIPRLAMVMVPRAALTVVKPLVKSALPSLDTTWMSCDTWVENEAVLGRPGLGLAVASAGFGQERLAIAANIAGVGQRVIGLTAAHLHRRSQFGRPLIEHQALRLRLADLSSRLTVLQYAVYGAATASHVPGGCGYREAAAIKVTAARFGERLTSECLHMFGGAGFLEDETPLAALWRDARVGRIGAGTDEVLWEFVAAGLVPDFDEYDSSVDLYQAVTR
jgi:acyl-ACP dehydrogenase